MNRIVTIGREFGSGGRELGRRLSEIMGIAYYDKEIVTEIAKRTSMSEEYVHHIIEHKPVVSYPISIGRSFYPMVNPITDQQQTIYQEQHRIIREMAEKSDCIIVGRCGDYIPKEQDPFRIFVYAEMESKMARCRERGAEHENLSDRELKQQINRVDKNRSKYYEFYTGHRWGERLNYDLCINTTGKSIKQLAPLVAHFLTECLGEAK